MVNDMAREVNAKTGAYNRPNNAPPAGRMEQEETKKAELRGAAFFGGEHHFPVFRQ